MHNEWDPEQVLRDMELESQMDATGAEVDGRPDYAKTAERLIQENLPAAASCMVHLGLYSENEKIRLEAAKELLNRGLGKATDRGIVDEDSDPLSRLTGQFIMDAEEFANAGTAVDGTSSGDD